MKETCCAYGSWKDMDVVSVKQFDENMLRHLFQVTDTMRKMVDSQGGNELLKGKVLANIFYEPSTRTSSSFQAAMLRLGGSVISINESSSSVQKGESLSDTFKSMACYSDVIVLRHPVKGSAATAADAVTIPVLNAGDGVGEHPTQALLDIYTVYCELGVEVSDLRGKVITMVGDLKNGRTVHSLAKLLAKLHVKLNYVAPESLQMPEDIIEELKELGIEQHQTADLHSVIAASDVIYVTRIQKERFESQAEYDAVKDSFCITPDTMSKAHQSAILMHPLPRVNEISTEVDRDPRAAYFRQMKNGMFVRMALLALVLGMA